MDIYRIAGALLVALSGVFGAYFLNSGAKMGLARTEGFIALIRYLRSQIECFSMSLPRAFADCPRDIYEKCGYTAKEPPDTVAELLAGCGALEGETERVIRSFAARIGRGYREEQLSLCDYCIECLEENRRAISAQLPSKKKLNGVLCLCGALAVVILLI